MYLSLKINYKDMSLKSALDFEKKSCDLKKNTNKDWCRFRTVWIIVAVESFYSNSQSHLKLKISCKIQKSLLIESLPTNLIIYNININIKVGWNDVYLSITPTYITNHTIYLLSLFLYHGIRNLERDPIQDPIRE